MDFLDGANDEAGASPPALKRQRAKHACEPCRLRKRKCDGSMPCNMCKQFEYRCYFEKHPRKRSKIVEQNAQNEISGDHARSEPPKEDQANVEDLLKLRNMEANSGIAFTRLLGQRLDPSGPKLFTFGWNLGATTFVPPPITPITDFLNQDQMYLMAQHHFRTIHLLYAFLDKEWILEQISLRWAQPELCKVPDHLFANLAALGSAFSEGSISSIVPSIVVSAKNALDNTSLMQPPNLLDIQSWLLRSLYLRLTDHPHAVHMAACAAMHLAESIGLHQEDSDCVLNPSLVHQPHDLEIRRRTFWVARMINTWVSFEYGRMRVSLRGITTKLPTPQEGDYTVEYLDLYSLSCYLDPERSDSKLEEFLRRLEEYETKHDAIELSRANIGLCGYRRIRLTNPYPSNEVLNRTINMGLKGLEAARRICAQGMPWWHVANLPFQVICVFLAMDVKESLAHVSTAMRVLEDVVARFQTAAAKEALKTARFLVRLSKKRKDEDAEMLNSSLKKDAVNGDPQPENPQPLVHVNTSSTVEQTPMSANSEDWSYEVLKNFPEFDWNFFLTTEMPAFNSFAPDGTM